MKINFKKISAIGASALLTGMTMGVAAAASFPQPFVVGGTADVAIVYGTGTGVSSLDLIQSGNIQTSLQSYMSGTTSTSTSSVSGEALLFETGTNKLNINNNLTDIKTVALDGDDLPTILKSGTYSNQENSDFDYDQKIDINPNVQFSHFADNDYNDKMPTIGIRIAKGDNVLNYSLDFVKAAEDDTSSSDDLDDFEDTTIEILGKTYEITTATNTSAVAKFILMAGVDKGVLNYQETGTYDVDGTSYEVTLTYVDQDECKFTVNGVSTDKLMDGATDKLADGETLIGVTEVDYSIGATTEVMSCEFYIGANKLELEHDKEVEIDDVAVSKLKTYFHDTYGNPYKLDKIVLEWDADDDLFITEDNDLTMPGFGSIKFTSGGLIAPTGELIKIRGSSNEEIELTVPIKSGTATIQLLGSNESSGFDVIGGGDDGEGLATTTYNGSGAIGVGGASLNIMYNLTTMDKGHQYFVATHLSGADGSSYLVEIADSDDTDGVDFRDAITGTALATDIKNGTSFTIGDSSFSLDNFIEDQYAIINITGTTTYVDRVVSEEGMVIYLPVANITVDVAAVSPVYNKTAQVDGLDTSYILWMEEEDKDGTLQGGTSINVTLGHTASTNSYNTEATFSATSDNVCSGGEDFEDATDDNYYICYTASDLGTKVEYNSDLDEDTVDVTYYGEQVYGNIYIAEVAAEVSTTAAAVSGATQLGDVLVKDSEVSSVSSKNLIVVGGSCINSAAATALGVSQGTCGAAFTEATGVGSGEFLIKSVSDAFTTGKIALVVAGYEAADTVNAATYLRNQVVDTSKEYKGTSSTSATLVTTEA